MALEHEALTERIIAAAIEVHRRLGPGFLESIYEKALIIVTTQGHRQKTRLTAQLRQDNARAQASHCFLRLFLGSWVPHPDLLSDTHQASA